MLSCLFLIAAVAAPVDDVLGDAVPARALHLAVRHTVSSEQRRRELIRIRGTLGDVQNLVALILRRHDGTRDRVDNARALVELVAWCRREALDARRGCARTRDENSARLGRKCAR